MRKITLVLMTLSLMSVLCGCMATTTQDHQYLIASMGFDKNYDRITATVEAVAINSEDNAGKKRILLKGEGKTAQEAMEEAEKKATQPFDLSHCGVIVLGGNLTNKDFEKICDYCYDTAEITFSVYILSCENADTLLKAKPVSSVAAGYDLMSIIIKETEKLNKKFRNSLYEVVAEKNRKKGKVELPFFVLEDEYRVLTSVAVYEN